MMIDVLFKYNDDFMISRLLLSPNEYTHAYINKNSVRAFVWHMCLRACVLACVRARVCGIHSGVQRDNKIRV